MCSLHQLAGMEDVDAGSSTEAEADPRASLTAEAAAPIAAETSRAAIARRAALALVAVVTIAAAVYAVPRRALVAQTAKAPMRPSRGALRSFVSAAVQEMDDQDTILVSRLDAGDSKLVVEDPHIIKVGCEVVLVNSQLGSATYDDAVVISKEDDAIVIDKAFDASFPRGTYVLVPGACKVLRPTAAPTAAPTLAPTSAPTAYPTSAPTGAPTVPIVAIANDTPPPTPAPVLEESSSGGAPMWVSTFFALLTCGVCGGLLWYFLHGQLQFGSKRDFKPGLQANQTKSVCMAMAGTCQIQVESTSSFRVRDQVRIESDFGSDTAVITEVTPHDITLASDLSNTHMSGAIVTNLSGHRRGEDEILAFAQVEEQQQSAFDTPRRKSQIRALFLILDKNKAGTLDSKKLLEFAKADGFHGNQHDWDDYWASLSEEFGPRGCSLEDFEGLLGSRDSPMFCSDYELQTYLDRLDPHQLQHGHGMSSPKRR